MRLHHRSLSRLLAVDHLMLDLVVNLALLLLIFDLCVDLLAYLVDLGIDLVAYLVLPLLIFYQKGTIFFRESFYIGSIWVSSVHTI